MLTLKYSMRMTNVAIIILLHLIKSNYLTSDSDLPCRHNIYRLCLVIKCNDESDSDQTLCSIYAKFMSTPADSKNCLEVEDPVY
jgi:hypothetical protein